MLNSSADEANSVLRNYQIGSARQTSRLPQEMRYKPWWWPVDAVNGDQLFFAIKLSNTLSFSLQKRLHVTVKSGQLALQTRWQSSLILIKLDFHSRKWALWLVDSWSCAPDQIQMYPARETIAQLLHARRLSLLVFAVWLSEYTTKRQMYGPSGN